MASDSKKTFVLVGGIVIGVFVLFALKSAFANGSGAIDAALSYGGGVADGGAQEITLRLDPATLDYSPNPIRVKAGVPVRITVDLDSVRGCTSSIVMPSFGVKKRAVPGDNVIEFTPTERGTFPFSCAMGMSRGTIVVE